MDNGIHSDKLKEFMNTDTQPKEIDKSENKKNSLIEINIAINNVIQELLQNTNSFNKEKMVVSISNYIKKHERFMYSEISNKIYKLDTTARGIINTNLNTLVEYILSEEYKEGFCKNDEECEKIKKVILKLSDHFNLALYQIESLKQNNEEFKAKFTENIMPVKLDIRKDLDKLTKETNTQLISLVAIFTAMAFLVFGGINSLDFIFDGMKGIPILQILIIGCVWGICIFNTIFIFMYFISKLTRLPISSRKENNISVISKYSIFFLGNLFITTILLICGWLYYIDKKNIGSWFVILSQRCSVQISILGFIIIIGIFIFGIIKILNINILNRRTENLNE